MPGGRAAAGRGRPAPPGALRIAAGGDGRLTLAHEDRALGTAARLFRELAERSADPPGITRDTYGAGEALAHDLVAREGSRLGLEVTRDALGNLYLTLPGQDRARPRLLMGSHLDSVPHGGNFDGAAGVIAGLAVLERLALLDAPPPFDVAVMAIRAEEMIWFPTHYLGSRAAFGLLPPDSPDALRRADTGRTLAEHMREQGFDPEPIRRGQATLAADRIGAFIELHIEQGPVLVEAGLPVGIVSAIRGNLRYRHGRISGAWSHAGGVPRAFRRDAALAAVALLGWLERRWLELEGEGHDLVVTAGELSTDPALHGITKVPGLVRFTLDIRSDDNRLLLALDRELRAQAQALSAARRVEIDPGPVTNAAPAIMSPPLRQRLQAQADLLGVPTRSLPSGGGHDCAVFAGQGIPSAMLFVRNDHGSHNPAEHMELADFGCAWRVLAATVDRLLEDGLAVLVEPGGEGG
jgi:N-carbamoyl-L-amino-acid hydrolase